MNEIGPFTHSAYEAMMKSSLLMVLLAQLVFASCSVRSPNIEPPILSVSLAEAPAFAPDDSSTPRWPQFVLPVRGGLLWAERSGLLKVEEVDDRLIVEGPALTEMTLGLDRLVAGAQGPFGEIALLDSSGRVSIRDRSGRLSGFATGGNRTASIAVADRSIYLLHQGEGEGGPAVFKYSFEGSEEGRWGQMPADGLIQSVLQGGGLVACPDGSVFYSYINSPRVARLVEDGRVELIGDPQPSFFALSPRDIRRAVNEGLEERSTQPLVRLGLGASRVMALFCSSENLLFRQVTGPGEDSMRIEVWDPAADDLVAILPHEEGVLLAVEGGMLQMGVVEEQRFELRKLNYSLAEMQPSRSR